MKPEELREVPAFDHEGFDTHLRRMAQLCGLPDTFLNELLLENSDWTFVVKCHALLESSVSMLLAFHLGRPELEETIAKVDMSSRIAMLDLKLASDDERRMMRAFGELRNKLVHNTKQTTFRFEEHLADKQRRQSFFDTYAHFARDGARQKNAESSEQLSDLLKAKLAMWTSVLGIMSKTVTELTRQMLDQERNKAIRALIEAGPEPARGQATAETDAGSPSPAESPYRPVE